MSARIVKESLKYFRVLAKTRTGSLVQRKIPRKFRGSYFKDWENTIAKDKFVSTDKLDRWLKGLGY